MTEQNNAQFDSGCLICGAPLVYFDEAKPMECMVCHKKFMATCACEKEHFVCNRCHSQLNPEYMDMLRASTEKDPMVLLQRAMESPGIHMNGPEHHPMVPCVLLTAYRNCGGELNYPSAMKEAFRRGQLVPGGACGYGGVCGAMIGAGIYGSLILGGTPVKEGPWAKVQELTARIIKRIAEIGGVRCCKRTTHIAIEEAVAWTREVTGIEIPLAPHPCTFYDQNRECMFADCPYFE